MTTLRYGISHLPADDDDDAGFIDGLVGQGHRALELPFTGGFPWKEKRCESFGLLAAERDVRLSVRACFAGLTMLTREGRHPLPSSTR
jgi:hypothetical protein